MPAIWMRWRGGGPTLISKTTFPEFQMCPKNAWLKLHKPELLEQFKLSDLELHLVEQGSEVELAARALWGLMAFSSPLINRPGGNVTVSI